MKFSKDMSNRLKSARQHAGFHSARAFAMAHNIPYVTYSQHESGGRRLNPDTLVKYAGLLNVSPAWILSGEDVGQSEVSENKEGVAYCCKATDADTQGKNKIDLDLFLMLFDEIHAFIKANIKENKSGIAPKDEIKLCVDFYNVISGNASTNEEKRAMVKNLLHSITQYKQSSA